MIRAVISDLGKVILWFDNKIFFRKLAPHSPHSPEKIRERILSNFNLVELFDKGKLTPEEFYEKVAVIFDAKISRDDFFAAYRDVFWLNPPVLPVLKKLRGQCRLVLLSNTDIARFGYIREKFPEILIFDAYVLSYEVGFMKPHPKIYEAALEEVGALASECVFIDDLDENIEGAGRLGMKTVLYKPGTDLEKELQALGLIF